MSGLRTRKPSGRPAWPLVLVEGEEKAGKSFMAFSLSASPYVHRTFVFDLGDGVADEYAALGPYEVVELTGTHADLVSQLSLAIAEPAGGDGQPNAFVIDSGTDLWDNLKHWADQRAKHSRKGAETLKKDPDAEIDVAMNLWNDAKDRWAEVVGMLRRSGGIGVITAQGAEVTRIENGQPTRDKVWSVQAEKTLPANASAWVRVRRDPRTATLVGARRLGLEVPVGGLALPLENTLHHLVFEIIGGGTTFEAPSIVPAQVGLSRAKAMRRLLDTVVDRNPAFDSEDAKHAAKAIWEQAGIEDAELTDAQVRMLLDAVPESATPAASPEPAPVPAEAPEPEPEAHEPAAAPEEQHEAHSAPDESEPEPVPDDGIRVPEPAEPERLGASRIRGMLKVEAVAALGRRGLSTAGPLAELRERLVEYEEALS